MTTVTVLWQHDASSLAEAYRRGKADPVDGVRECLDRIHRIGPALNAFTALAEDAEAQAAESRGRLNAEAPRGPLEGVPIAVKDNLCVSGMPAAWGSKVFATKVCEKDELPVKRLRDAGAIIIGKTNTPEFAVEGYTANTLFGVTRNPWDLNLTPGGSSGGSVAATAAGLVPVAIGTDGGGSIRRPAAYTGLYGLKPTIGRVPRSGGLPQLLLDFEVVGPLARTVRDLKLLYSVLGGPDRSDPQSRGVGERQSTGKASKALKILYVDRFGDEPCDPLILQSCRKAADRLIDLGHNVEEGALPINLSALNQFWGTVAQVGLARMRHAVSGMRERAGPQYQAMADLGDAVSATDFLAGLEDIKTLRSAVSQVFANWDLIMTPACAAMPWAAENPFPGEIDGKMAGPRGHAIYTGWVNASGHPAIALPADPAPDGLPIGFQLIGDLAAEDLLLEIAAVYEETHEGNVRWPDVALGDG